MIGGTRRIAAGNARERLNVVSTIHREIADLDQALGCLAQAMGEASRDKLLAEGRRISLDEAVLVAIGERGKNRGVSLALIPE